MAFESVMPPTLHDKHIGFVQKQDTVPASLASGQNQPQIFLNVNGVGSQCQHELSTGAAQ